MTSFFLAALFSAVVSFFLPGKTTGRVRNWVQVSWFCGLTVVPLPALGLGGGGCIGPNCPSLLEMLIHLMLMFAGLNVLAALWMIAQKIRSIWQRWRDPQAPVPTQQTDSQEPPSS
ncbi:hypothetical protein K5F93_09955 [Pseudomonas protegens]|uniref:hypothetical protein n=1 Tax=Pseudomonas protegens TaxID=380021 RepID=UPI001C8EF83A|nr:hypothetical protein [Pseudomonas protegens]QZI72568.1 hypothetical protein K5F93_09955 [Pseudomonas protegens]